MSDWLDLDDDDALVTDARTSEPRIPVVLATLPRCPGCGAADKLLRVTKTYRPIPETDGKTQYVDCTSCGQRFKVDWE